MTSARILARDGREMGPMGSGISKTVQSTQEWRRFGVLGRTPSGPTHLGVRPAGRPPRQGQGPERGGGAATLFPAVTPQPPPLTCREVTSPARPLSSASSPPAEQSGPPRPAGSALQRPLEPGG